MSAPIETFKNRWGAGATHSLCIARRNLLHIRSDPQQLIGMTLQPLLFLSLFIFVFGGSVAGSAHGYLQYALVGILVQTCAYTGFQTALGLNLDFQTGLIDRFRSLPMAQSAVVAGRILADLTRALWGMTILTTLGVILGFRFLGGGWSALGALALMLTFAFAIFWPMAFIGVTTRTPEAASTLGLLLLMPLTYASSIFAPPESMPVWFRAFVRVNPVTHVVDTVRALVLGEPYAGALIKAATWIVGMVAVFAPLTIACFQRSTDGPPNGP